MSRKSRYVGLSLLLAGAIALSPVFGQETAFAAQGASYPKDNKSTKKKRGSKKSSPSLAGKKGTVYGRTPRYHQGQCGKGFKRYVDEKGHSAFASTNMNLLGGVGYVCFLAYGAPSTKVAEQAALRGCNRMKKKYKHAQRGECKIVASK